MKFWVDIASPSEMFMHVSWPADVPVPAIGDTAIVRAGPVTWTFCVVGRTISIGVDPRDMTPAGHAVL